MECSNWPGQGHVFTLGTKNGFTPTLTWFKVGKEGFQKIVFTSREFGVGSKHYIHTYSDKYFMQAVSLVEIEERAEFLIWLSQCGKGPQECHIQMIPKQN